MKKLIAAAFAVLALAGATGAAQAQSVRIVVGYPPGGGVDALARMIATPLSEALGKSVVVDNRAGASGQIAAQALKTAPPDGNTLMLAPAAIIVVAPHSYSKLPYAPLEDFVPVAHMGTFEYGLVVAANSPFKSFRDWMAAVKANPKAGAYGTPGLGTGPHFVGMMLAHETGMNLEAVSYKGVAPATTDVVSGQVGAVILPYGQLDPFIKGGKVRVLAHTGDVRSTSLPDVPTFKESGYGALEIIDWYGLFAPAGTSPELVQRYNAIVNQALRTPDVRAKMAALGLGVKEMQPDAMAGMVRSDFARWRGIVKSTGYSADSK